MEKLFNVLAACMICCIVWFVMGNFMDTLKVLQGSFANKSFIVNIQCISFSLFRNWMKKYWEEVSVSLQKLPLRPGWSDFTKFKEEEIRLEKLCAKIEERKSDG